MSEIENLRDEILGRTLALQQLLKVLLAKSPHGESIAREAKTVLDEMAMMAVTDGNMRMMTITGIAHDVADEILADLRS